MPLGDDVDRFPLSFTPKKMQRLDWSLSRKVTQDIKTQPQINHYHKWFILY